MLNGLKDLQRAFKANLKGTRYFASARYVDAEREFKTYLELIIPIVGPGCPEVIEIFMILAQLYKLLGEYDKAENTYRTAVENCKNNSAVGPGLIADTLNGLGSFYNSQLRLEEAAPLIQQALEIRKQHLGTSHPDYAASLVSLGFLHRNKGSYNEARNNLETAVKLLSNNVNSSTKLLYSDALAGLASIYTYLGLYRKAIENYNEAYSLLEHRLNNHLERKASIKGSLGYLYMAHGDFITAEACLTEALDVRKAIFGVPHKLVAVSLNDLGMLQYYQGQYDQAYGLLLEAIAVLENCEEGNYDTRSTIYNNMCLCIQITHNYEKSLELLGRALENNDLLENPTSGKAIILNNRSALYREQGFWEEAYNDLVDALFIIETSKGTNNLDYAYCLNNIAMLYQDDDQNEAAAELLETIYDILVEVGAENHPLCARVVLNYAVLAYCLGTVEVAEQYFRQAIDLHRAILGNSHFDLARALHEYAVLLAEKGEHTAAFNCVSESCNIQNGILYRITSAWPEQTALGLAEQTRISMNLMLSILMMNVTEDLIRPAFELVIKNKAIVYDTVALRCQTIKQQASSELEELLQDQQAMRNQLSNYTLGLFGGLNPHDIENAVENLEKQIYDIEEELIRRLPQASKPLNRQNMTAADLAKLMPAGSFLLEFIRIGDTNLGEARERYVVFVMPADDPERASFIQLAETEVLEQAVSHLCGSLTIENQETPDDTETASRNLYNLLLEPLLPEFKTGENQGLLPHLFIAPDGELYRVPFECLLGPDNRFLIEHFSISYLTAGRELKNFKESPCSSSGAYIIADPDYDLELDSINRSGPDVDATRDSLRSKYFPFARLSGAYREGRHIEQLLQNSIPTVLMTGQNAVENRIKSIKRPTILHFATHGFFLPYTNNINAMNHEASIKPGWGSVVKAGPIINPLLRSGLVLAGINSVLLGNPVPAEAEDGILTALDVLECDLLGTELVTLAACETGLGEVQMAEGVSGLRKAFILAGARTLLVSLWNVPDNETREIMQVFYSHLMEGQKKSDSLRLAQLEIIQEMRNLTGHFYINPFWWAGFIVHGNIAPLNLHY